MVELAKRLVTSLGRVMHHMQIGTSRGHSWHQDDVNRRYSYELCLSEARYSLRLLKHNALA